MRMARFLTTLAFLGVPLTASGDSRMIALSLGGLDSGGQESRGRVWPEIAAFFGVRF